MVVIENSIKIFLILLFLLCLLHMPYMYYQIVRFVGMLGFLLLAYFSIRQKNIILVLIYISLALLFQPFIKVTLGRTVWNIVDIVISIGLIISIIVNYKKTKLNI